MNIYQVIYAIWFLSEIILNRIARSGKSDKKSTDKNSEIYIWITIILCITISVYISIKYSCPILPGELLLLIGTLIIITGIIIRFIAIIQLGRFFTVNVTIRNDHQLVQRGFYKYLRHPSYTGSLLSFLGFGISLNNWFSLAIVFLPTVLAFIYRINIEENVLVEQFGEQYRDYMRKTKRIIPFIY
jgi:protein-S-isoprenylcysteine O-methyltransferase Ste14